MLTSGKFVNRQIISDGKELF